MAEISFAAEGKRLPGFRDAVRFRGIKCRQQQIRENIFYAQTSAFNEKRLSALAAEYGITLRITARRGLRYRLLPYRKRFGLLAGLLCGIRLIHWCNATVREIVITGNTRVSVDELRAALSDLGVTNGARFSDLPYAQIEQRMRLAVSDIEWINVRHEGGRLIVDLTEERRPPEMDFDRIPTNYIAQVPAQITKVDVRGGYACVQLGDTVQAGDLLISGVHEDAKGVTRFYHGDGFVTGRYAAQFVQEQPFAAELPVSGDVIPQTVLECFGRQIPLTVGFRKPDAPGTVLAENREQLTLFGRALPIAVLHRRYTLPQTAVTVFSEEEAKAILEESAARFERNFHANDIIISRSAEFSRSDLGILLKINYIFEGVIGKTSEIFVKLS
ncbi:MAG: sporulation protein YqfD [Oscillospiraceae bacterium]|nr:sporulation protein YqfD [Oscillospiraceae bacterium]